MSGFCRILWQSFYPLLTKEPKDICLLADKPIIPSLQYIVSSDILSTKTAFSIKITD